MRVYNRSIMEYYTQKKIEVNRKKGGRANFLHFAGAGPVRFGSAGRAWKTMGAAAAIWEIQEFGVRQICVWISRA